MPDMVVKAGDFAELNVAAYSEHITIVPPTVNPPSYKMKGSSIIVNEGNKFCLQSDVEDVLIKFDYATPDYPNQGTCHVKFNKADLNNVFAQICRERNSDSQQNESFALKGTFFKADLTFDKPAVRYDISGVQIHPLAITHVLRPITVNNGLKFKLSEDPFFVKFF